MRNFLGCVSIILAINLNACHSYDDVRESENGIHEVVLVTERKTDGYREARKQAKNFCDEDDKKPVVVKEKSQYVGGGSEDTYNNTKNVSKAAKYGGSTVAIFGGDRATRKAGGAVGLGGFMGDAFMGEGYEYSMKFKCVPKRKSR